MLLPDPRLEKLCGRAVAQRRVLPFSVVEHIDVFEGDRLDLGLRRVANAMHPFILEAVEPAFASARYPSSFLFGSSSRSCRTP